MAFHSAVGTRCLPCLHARNPRPMPAITRGVADNGNHTGSSLSLINNNNNSNSSFYLRPISTAVPSSSKTYYDATTSLRPIPENAHRVVLMRHGESEFNNANIFTGWCDIHLTQRGIVEAVEAGEVFRSHGLVFRHCYTSILTRSIVTAQRTLEAAGVSYTPMSYDWRLNERHYGALQGLSKERTADRLGRTMVMQWRRSYDARPPLMAPEHPHYDIIHNDPRYRNIPEIPLGESLQDCQKRVLVSWNDIVADVCKSNPEHESPYSLVVAHANTLRALVMHIDNIPDNEIEGLNIPTGIPFFYDIDKQTGQVVYAASSSSITKNNEVNRIGAGHFRGIYISDERKKRSFLERRRAANDPWLWALHDDQVCQTMLVGKESYRQGNEQPEGVEGLEEEAKHNTELYTSAYSN